MKNHDNQPRDVHWVLVADASRAQVFESDETLAELTPIDAHTHPATRLPVSELVSGDRGATREYAGAVHSRFERHSDPHRATIDEFARELGEVLSAGRIAHRFEHLVIIAPPAFLGALRSHIDVDSSRLVVGSIPHDWTSVPLHELPDLVRDAMPKVSRAS